MSVPSGSVGARRGTERRRDQLQRVWRQVRPYAIGTFAATAVVLGAVGFTDLEPERSTSSAVYRALQLFALGSGAVDGEVPLTLEIARFLAPLAVAGALLTALAAVFRSEVSTHRARLARGHTIIAGMSEAADLLARDVRRAGGSVVVVAPEALDPRVMALQREGFPVLVADPAHPIELRRAGLARADHLVALADTTAANAAIAAGVLDAQNAIDDRNKRFRSFIAVDDPALLVALQSSSEAKRLHLRQEFFSLTQRAAVAALDTLVERGSPLHRLAVIGSGDAAGAVVVEALRRADDDTVQSLTVYADQARTAVDFRRVLERDTPALRTRRGRARLDRVEVVDVDEHLGQAELETLLFDGDAPDAAVLALTDPSQLLRWSMMWRDARGSGVAPGVTITRSADGLTSFLGTDHAVADAVSVVSILREGCVDQRIVSGRLDRMARAIHEDYLRYVRLHEPIEEPSTHPAARPWSELDPRIQQRNVDAAQAVWAALETTGHRVVPLHTPGAEDLEFDDESLRRLVEMEHTRWLGAAPGQGGTVAWEQIDEADRRKTEAQVRNLPRVLADAGLEIVPVLTSTAASADPRALGSVHGHGPLPGHDEGGGRQ